MTRRQIAISVFVCGLSALSLSTASAQEAKPEMMRIGFTKLKSGGLYDYQELAKLVNEAYKKSGVPWREVWATSLFGETGTMVSVAPVKNMAQFDEPSPMNKLETADRTKYTTLLRNAIESTHWVLVQTVPSLSIVSQRKDPPKFARVTTIRVKPGKQMEFEDLIKNTLLPAIKNAGFKDYWVNRTMVGGPLGEYTTLQIFDKWAEVDAWPGTEKLLGGAAAYKKFLAGIAETVDNAENMIARTVPELSYRNSQ
jgi:hypothetical protein